ncbi:MAG: hypothetical protein Q4F85_02125 [Prevotella sp.]|nr:hypothetical protein [Prevotella sp.]
MKILKAISTPRKISRFQSAQIVYEWEDTIISNSNIKLEYESKFQFVLYSIIERLGMWKLYNKLLKGKNLKLRFIMTAKVKRECIINKNTIPVIIDYWLTDEQIKDFCLVYRYCPLVLVTNAEVYCLLKKHNVPLPIEHWPLSYPDKYAISSYDKFEKRYDFCLLGRPNPFFIRLLDKYCESHKEFTYIKNAGTIDYRYYETNTGLFVGKDTGRKSYLEMVKQTKITCYTTPGYDESKKDVQRFNQVTPRVFEFLCGGCMVIGHYPMTEDVLYYQLDSIIYNVNNYTEFESKLDELRKKECDISKNAKFMEQHYTSKRINSLVNLCKKHNISII